MNAPPRPIGRDEILARVAAVAPILDRTAAQSERARTLCPEALDALHDAGLFGLWGTVEAGGWDADLTTQVDALVALARADMSACWTLMIGVTVTGALAAGLPEEGFREIFAGPRLPIAVGSLKPSGRAERTSNGYRTTGRWGFGSGIHHADWIVANCLLAERGEPVTPRQGVSLAIPVAEVHVADDWHAVGLCATGSSSYAVTDVFVPDRRALQPRRQRGSFQNANPGPRIPIEHASVYLGGARRALDEVARLATSKRRLGDPATVADKQSFQVEFGRLEAQWLSLLAGVRQCAADLWRAFDSPPDIPPAARRLKAVCAHATEQSLAIGGRAFRHAGAAAIQGRSVLQRVYRDLAASAQHVMVSDAAYEEHGKMLLADGSNPDRMGTAP